MTIVKKKNKRSINIFFDKNGISIIELLELDFSDFVNQIIREKIK